MHWVHFWAAWTLEQAFGEFDRLTCQLSNLGCVQYCSRWTFCLGQCSIIDPQPNTSALLLFLFLVLWLYINLIYSSKTLCSFVNLVCMCQQWSQPSCRLSNQNWRRSSPTSTRCWDALTRSQRTNTAPQVHGHMTNTVYPIHTQTYTAVQKCSFSFRNNTLFSKDTYNQK